MRKRQMERLAAGLAVIDRDRREAAGGVDEDTLTEAEQRFLSLADAKGKLCLRSGWPDFLVIDRDTGGVVWVEVKAERDEVRPSQIKMFAALEKHADIRVMVWNPRTPNKLVPWRQYTNSIISEESQQGNHGPRIPVLGRVKTAEREEV